MLALGHPLERAAAAIDDEVGPARAEAIAQTAIQAYLMAQQPEALSLLVFGQDNLGPLANTKAVIAGLMQQVEPDPEGRTLDQIAADVSEGRFKSMHELLQAQARGEAPDIISDQEVREAAADFNRPHPAPPAPGDGTSLSERLGANAAEQCALAMEVGRLEATLATSGKMVEMIEALKRCAHVFRHYSTLHFAKGTDEGKTKAEANLAMAELCERALGLRK